MKIIFDNEEQKEKMIDEICPNNFLENYECPYRFYSQFRCSSCWGNCGIELEVKEKENE